MLYLNCIFDVAYLVQQKLHQLEDNWRLSGYKLAANERRVVETEWDSLANPVGDLRSHMCMLTVVPVFPISLC